MVLAVTRGAAALRRYARGTAVRGGFIHVPLSPSRAHRIRSLSVAPSLLDRVSPRPRAGTRRNPRGIALVPHPMHRYCIPAI